MLSSFCPFVAWEFLWMILIHTLKGINKENEFEVEAYGYISDEVEANGNISDEVLFCMHALVCGGTFLWIQVTIQGDILSLDEDFSFILAILFSIFSSSLHPWERKKKIENSTTWSIIHKQS